MINLSKYLNQSCVVWPVSGHDEDGNVTYGTPVEVKGRYVGRNKEVVTGKGENVTSQAQVITINKYEMGSLIKEGTLAQLGSSVPVSALPVIAVDDFVWLDGTLLGHKYYM